MHRVLGGCVGGARVAKGGHVDSGEEVFAFAQKHRTERKMQLIDQASKKILPDRVYAAANADVFVPGDSASTLTRRMEPSSDTEKELTRSLDIDSL